MAALLGSEVVAVSPGGSYHKNIARHGAIKKREKDGKKGWLCVWCNIFFRGKFNISAGLFFDSI